MNPSVLACTPQMAFYHWSEKGGIGEPLLFALWIISGNTGHTEVFSTYTMRCPHISAIFSLWNFPASPLLGPSLMPWRRHPSKALRATPPLPALPGDTPASELEARAVPDLWGTPVCLQVEEAMLSASRGAALCVCPPSSPRPASGKELPSGAARAARAAPGPFLREPHAGSCRW